MIEPLRNFEGFNISFHVTEECNLRCRYCYEISKRPRDLPFEYAERFISLILDDPDPAGVVGSRWEAIMKKGLILDFIGGDALRKPELCDKIIRSFLFNATLRRHRWASNFRISISTNGTLFEEPGVKEFLENYKDVLSLGVSVDGCPELQELNRPGSFKRIMKSWDWYMNFTGGRGSTKSTLNNESIPYLYRSVRFLHEELGLKYINMNFVFDRQESEPDPEELDRQLEMTAEYVRSRKDELYLSLFDRDMRIGGPCREPGGIWCGAGAMPCVDVDGWIYPCFRFVAQNLAPEVSPFVVGDVFRGFYLKDNFRVVREQTRERISPEECLACDVESSCAWCIAGGYAETGEFYRQRYVCGVNRLQAKWAGWYWGFD